MRVLVTGASGFLGRHVMRELRLRGHAVIALGRRPVPDTETLTCDLLARPDLDAVTDRARASHLVHLAWEAGHGAYWTHPDNARWALATADLVRAFCSGGGKGIVVAGSSAEYDWTQGWCREDATPLMPATLYGQAKDAARRLCQLLAGTARVPLAWGRVFLSCGPGEDARRLVPSVIDALRGRRPPFAIDLGAQRDLLHASDTASAMVHLLESGWDGVANVSSGQPVPLGEIVAGLALATGTDPAPLMALGAERPGEPRLLAGEPARLATLGWHPRLTLAEALQRCAAERL